MAEIILFNELATGTYVSANNAGSSFMSNGATLGVNTSNVSSLIQMKSKAGIQTIQGGDRMDESTRLLLERMDKDIRDHKQEIRDRDQRLQSEMQEREDRIHKELKEREDRLLQAIRDSNIQIQQQLSDIKESVGRSEIRLDETAKHVHSMVTQNFWGRLAAIVTILAICATVGATVWAAYN